MHIKLGHMDIDNDNPYRLLCSDFAHKPPDMNTLSQILEASNFFRMSRYREYAVQVLEGLFPKAFRRLPEVSPHAARAVDLGRTFHIDTILPHAFYDLARIPPQAPEDITHDAEDNLVPKISIKDMQFLLHLQKRLSMAWDDIMAKTETKCNRVECSSTHRLPALLSIKQRYPLDPLLGINELLKIKLTMKGPAYCEVASNRVQADLKTLRTQIWCNIRKWIGVDV